MRGQSLLIRLRGGILGATALMLFCLLSLTSGEAEAAGSHVDFDRHEGQEDLASGTESGVTVARNAVKLAEGKKSGTLTSKTYTTATRFDTLVPSWNATTPSGTYIQLDVRVRSGGGWTGWFDMGTWARGTETIQRRSQDGQRSGDWSVATDTLKSNGPVFADAYEYRVKLSSEKSGRSPKVRSVAVTASDSYRHGEFLGVTGGKHLGTDLMVPERSQMVHPDGGQVWCSPTSLSMVMQYWSNKTNKPRLDQEVPTVARGTYDYEYGGTGNWPFNTAYASSFGLTTSVNRFSSLGQAERWVAKGVPVVASLKWGTRQLAGAHVDTSDGHLMVIRGFTEDHVIVNDPAADPKEGEKVKTYYKRQQFADAWMRGSGGIVYLLYPKDWDVPDATDARGSW